MAGKEIENIITYQLKRSNRNFRISENWIYSLSENSRRQGWKIHISCNLYNLEDLIKKVIPVLIKLDANFKIVRSHEAFKELNTDIKQLGKPVTIYPISNVNAVHIIQTLKPHLKNVVGPRIITDTQINHCNVLQYRYGSFSRAYTDAYGNQISYVTDTHNKKIIDNQELGYVNPTHSQDPFLSAKLTTSNNKKSQLTNYHVERYLLNQNKLLYLGRLRNKNKEIIIKQARINFKNNAAEAFQHELLRNEFEILSKLNGLFGTPKPIRLFEEEGILYAVIEAIKSVSVYEYIEHSYYKCYQLDDNECLFMIREVLKLFNKYYQKKLILGDINPNNIIIDDKGNLRFIDFEYSHLVGKRWYRANTYGFAPPFRFTNSGVCNDLYCIISTIIFIATGRKLYLNSYKKAYLHKDFVNRISASRPNVRYEFEEIFSGIQRQINQCESNGS